MANIEAIIVDGVRYDRVKAKTQPVCEECELKEVCENQPYFGFASKCDIIVSVNECWKRKGE